MAADTKYCSNCGEEIDDEAEICPECGVRQEPASNNIGGGGDPGIAALLSFFIVGAGQLYNGEVAKGIILFILAGISGILMLVLIGFITTPIIWLYGIYDAYNTAQKQQGKD